MLGSSSGVNINSVVFWNVTCMFVCFLPQSCSYSFECYEILICTVNVFNTYFNYIIYHYFLRILSSLLQMIDIRLNTHWIKWTTTASGEAFHTKTWVIKIVHKQNDSGNRTHKFHSSSKYQELNEVSKRKENNRLPTQSSRDCARVQEWSFSIRSLLRMLLLTVQRILYHS